MTQAERVWHLQRRWAALDYDHDIRAGEAAFDLEAALVGPDPLPQQEEYELDTTIHKTTPPRRWLRR
jgi:hypothetical protein